ncbi:hypothetical protein RRG08_041936 [Elysia crispata]|uniref:Uncharacterized protein n=1 Tax=Elysia crispata TaxID=231223 RepID=A0AAE0XYG3_9GAST|nr:hypothetical protein RRG08_041936 [Elysia crispata]
MASPVRRMKATPAKTGARDKKCQRLHTDNRGSGEPRRSPVRLTFSQQNGWGCLETRSRLRHSPRTLLPRRLMHY